MKETWVKKYMKLADKREEAEKAKQKDEWVKELETMGNRLLAKYKKEAKYIEETIIPYINRMCHYPESYRSIVEGYYELLKYGKRQNRRIW